MAKVINGRSIPNMPWQDRPAGCDDIFWRYSDNPILTYKDVKKANIWDLFLRNLRYNLVWK